MGMSIDEAIKYYSNKNIVLTEEEALANTIALNTMRKYQKIQEVMDSRPDDSAKSNSKALGKIEVIMYGND